MEADTSRLESGLAGAESRLLNLEREFKTLELLFAGKTRQNVVFPSGVDGFNQIFEVIAMPLAIIEAETAGGAFICTYDADEKKLTIGNGSYQHPIGTNVDVGGVTGTGQYAYACIRHSASGYFSEFKLEVTSDTKDPVNMNQGGTFVEWSNILLAEVKSITLSSGDSVSVAVQRRIGNLALQHRVVNGKLCLWAETTGGGSL